jgi:hypothetical protein
MNARAEIARRIEKKREEIAAMRIRIRETEVYISALEDALKLMPREGVNEGDAGEFLRPNSKVAIARELLLAAGKPLHVQALLESMRQPDTRSNRSALAGSLGAYVRKGEIFSRPMPNTFGLIEWEHSSSHEASNRTASVPRESSGERADDDLPAFFGGMRDNDSDSAA